MIHPQCVNKPIYVRQYTVTHNKTVYRIIHTNVSCAVLITYKATVCIQSAKFTVVRLYSRRYKQKSITNLHRGIILSDQYRLPTSYPSCSLTLQTVGAQRLAHTHVEIAEGRDKQYWSYKIMIITYKHWLIVSVKLIGSDVQYALHVSLSMSCWISVVPP
jgi:hypothetical protein